MRIKKLFISLMLIVSCLCFVSCKDKSSSPENGGETTSPKEPVVEVNIGTGPWYEGDALSSVSISLAGGSTAGTISWKNQDYVLQLGENSCAWVFTPTDTSSFKSKEGTKSITAVKKLLIPTISDVKIKDGTTIYLDSKLELIKNCLECIATYNGETIEGTISWKNRDFVLANETNQCEWVFTPAESSVYAEVSGNIEVKTNATQTFEKVELKNAVVSGYKAFDEFDSTGLSINLIYNAGKVEEVALTADNFTLEYPEYKNESSNCFHKGDKWVKVYYTDTSKGLTLEEIEITIDEVDYYRVAAPVHKEILTYDGYAKTFNLVSDISGEQKYYEIDSSTVKGTNAGDYLFKVTIKTEYQDNCRWVDTDELAIQVTCKINKAKLKPVVSNYSDVYDGRNHSASVSCKNATKIYYSTSSDDFNDKNETPIDFKNAGTHKTFYLVVADDNHEDATGELVVEISKQTPEITLKDAYSIKTNAVINYPLSYISVKDASGNPLEITGKIERVYYKTYSASGEISSVKTSSSDGANVDGGAPSAARSSAYTVVVKYIGDDVNFAETEEVTTLFIDEDNNGFFGDFAFVDEAEYTDEQLSANGQASNVKIPISTKECGNYLEFKKCDINAEGLIEVSVSYKLSDCADEKDVAGQKDGGRLLNKGGKYYVELKDGKQYLITLSETGDTLNYEGTLTLYKWTIPNYLRTYTAKTVSDEVWNDTNYDKTKNSSQNTEIEIYNDFGTLKFIIRGNVKYQQQEVDDSSAPVQFTWEGVVNTRYGKDSKQRPSLIFEFYVNDSEKPIMVMAWNLPVGDLNNAEPETLTDNGNYLDKSYGALATTYTLKQD